MYPHLRIVNPDQLPSIDDMDDGGPSGRESLRDGMEVTFEENRQLYLSPRPSRPDFSSNGRQTVNPLHPNKRRRIARGGFTDFELYFVIIALQTISDHLIPNLVFALQGLNQNNRLRNTYINQLQKYEAIYEELGNKIHKKLYNWFINVDRTQSHRQDVASLTTYSQIKRVFNAEIERALAERRNQDEETRNNESRRIKYHALFVFGHSHLIIENEFKNEFLLYLYKGLYDIVEYENETNYLLFLNESYNFIQNMQEIRRIYEVEHENEARQRRTRDELRRGIINSISHELSNQIIIYIHSLISPQLLRNLPDFDHYLLLMIRSELERLTTEMFNEINTNVYQSDFYYNPPDGYESDATQLVD